MYLATSAATGLKINSKNSLLLIFFCLEIKDLKYLCIFSPVLPDRKLLLYRPLSNSKHPCSVFNCFFCKTLSYHSRLTQFDQWQVNAVSKTLQAYKSEQEKNDISALYPSAIRLLLICHYLFISVWIRRLSQIMSDIL